MGNKRDSRRMRLSGPGKAFKRRVFRGNQYAQDDNKNTSSSTMINEGVNTDESASSKKCKEHLTTMYSATHDGSNDIYSHYIILDNEILQDILRTVACCPKCNKRVVDFKNDISQKRDFQIYCS